MSNKNLIVKKCNPIKFFSIFRICMIVVNTKLPPTEKMRGWLDRVNFELKILKNGSDHPGDRITRETLILA
jgi:hypothetical protein